MRLLSGSAHPALSEEIAAYLGTPLTPVTRKRFADGECYVQIQDSIRGCDVFLLQPTCSPVHDSIMELMMGMLGLAGVRTFEKVKGVNRSSLKK
jgi:ribose-phosphate pyrophosphokinase